MPKIGRNDPCPCGSGKKWKKCHLGKEAELVSLPFYHHKMSGIKFDISGNSLSLYDRNKILLEGIIDIFSLKSGKKWHDIKKNISRDHVKELYKLIAWLWPPNADLSALLPKPENKLRAFYIGLMRPETVLNSVVRYSLYCDEILVTLPFLNPWTITEEHNPLVHPELFIGDTLKWVLYILNLAPWILQGHVIIIPDPGDFDYGLRKQTWDLAQVRLKDIKPRDLENELDWEKYAEADFKRLWLATPPDAMRQKLKEHDPKMSDQKIEEMMAYIEKVKEQDPLFPTNPNEQGMFGLHTSPTGANLEMGLYLSQLTGSYLYTDLDFRWKEISSIGNQSNEQQNVWGPITKTFQNLDFKFLDNVNTEFANKVRQDGRLESMRNFLRKTWLSLADSSDAQNSVSEGKILAFKDELVDEYHKAESDWQKIDADLLKWVTGSGGLGGVLAAGGMNWQIPALGFSLAGVGQLLNARYKRNRFRGNVPLSVFIDLKNKK